MEKNTMCKFHKDIARSIATDPVTDEFDAGKFAVALVAMAKFRIEQYMPAMHGCDGFVPAQMVTETAIAALAASGLKADNATIDNYHNDHIGTLRAAIDNVAAQQDLSLAALNIPDNITRGGYKHCAKMDADPTKAGPFLDEAVVQLFDGYDDAGKTWARDELHLKASAHKPEFENLRAAAAAFMAQPEIVPILHRMFEHSLIRIFGNAQADLAAGNGLDQTDGCVMCGHGSRLTGYDEDPAVTTITETPAAPTSLSVKFRDCARCARDGFGGAVLSHAGCLAMPALAGIFGLAVSGPLMAGMMLVTAPAIAVGATWSLARLRGETASTPKLATSAGIAVTLALIISTLTGGHDNHANHGQSAHDHHQGHNHAKETDIPFFFSEKDICTTPSP